MKSIIAILLLILPLTAHAQYNKSTNDTELKTAYIRQANKYKKSMIAGGVLLAVGAPMTSVGIYNAFHPDPYDDMGGFENIVLTSLAGSAVILGTVFTNIGIKGYHQYKRKLDALQVSFNMNPKSAGFKLVYNF